MIVKIQRPLFPPDAPVLVYNENRTLLINLNFQESGHVRCFLKDGEYKGYFEVELVDSRHSLKIIRRVADRDW